jgi:hypothetical protein
MKKLFTLAVGLIALTQSFAQVQRSPRADLINNIYGNNAVETSVNYATPYAPGENRYVAFVYMAEFASSLSYPTAVTYNGVAAVKLNTTENDITTKAVVQVWAISESALQSAAPAGTLANTPYPVNITWNNRGNGSYLFSAVSFRYVSQSVGIQNCITSNKGNSAATLTCGAANVTEGDLAFHFSMFTRDQITDINQEAGPNTRPVATNDYFGAPLINQLMPNPTPLPNGAKQFLATTWSATVPTGVTSYTPTFTRTTTQNPTNWIVSGSRVPFQDVWQTVSGNIWIDRNGDRQNVGESFPTAADNFYVVAIRTNGPLANQVAATAAVDATNGNYSINLKGNQVETSPGSGTYVNPTYTIVIRQGVPPAVGDPLAPASIDGSNLGYPAGNNTTFNAYYITNPSAGADVLAGPFSNLGMYDVVAQPPFNPISGKNAGIQAPPKTLGGSVSGANIFGASAKSILNDLGGSEFGAFDREDNPAGVINDGTGITYRIISDPVLTGNPGGTPAVIKLAYEKNGIPGIQADEEINAGTDSDPDVVDIPNFDMNKLYLVYKSGDTKGQGIGSFQYSLVDAAGQTGPATYDLTITLPVNGLELAGTYNSGKASLRWKLNGTDDVARYELERGNNASGFRTVATMSANGREYNHVDDLSAFTGSDAFYRVKLVRTNGSVSYSNIISLKLATITGLQLMPTVVQSNLQVRFNNTRSQDVTIRVMNISGQAVMTQTSKMSAGNASISLNGFERLTNGTYSVQVFAGTTVTQGKIVVQH